MAKFYGPIGFGVTKEETIEVPGETSGTTVKKGTGVWKDTIVERNYYGDVIQNYRKIRAGESINDNIDVSNQLSIVADPFAVQHMHTMRYVKWMGAVWKITTVEAQYPRLTLYIGGVYNGETAPTS